MTTDEFAAMCCEESASSTKRIDNFDRQVWEVVGAATAVCLTAIFGWPAAVGWLLGWGGGGLILFALATGRLSVRRRLP